MRLVGILAILLTVVLASCGYQKGVAKTEAQQQGKSITSVEWVDEQTGEVVFTIDDIVRFDWQRQIFQLKSEKAIDFLAWVGANVALCRGFVVRDNKGTIRKGAFISSMSSIAFFGPVIRIDSIPLEGHVPPPFYQVDGGYPTSSASWDHLIRIPDRLHNALEKKKLLADIDPSKVTPLKTIRTGWVPVAANGGGHILQVMAVIFPETFRIGKEARAYLLFYRGERYNLTAAEVEIHAILDANKGRFACDLKFPDVTPEVLQKRVYMCRFKPWGPVSGCAEAEAKPGPAEISFRVIIRDGQGKDEAVCEISPCTVEILPALEKEGSEDM